jgi:hypothetical protein
MIHHRIGSESRSNALLLRAFAKIRVFHVRKSEPFVKSTEPNKDVALHGQITRPPPAAGLIDRRVVAR